VDRLRRQLAAERLKLASRKAGGRDGQLVIVDRELARFVPVPQIAPTLQAALDHWIEVEPHLREIATALAAGEIPDARPFNARDCAAPLPRAYHWADGSAYVNHVEWR
jgi:fumarylacetoacetate (FAA) hydrolase